MIMAIALAITAMAGVRAQDTVQTGYRSFFGSESTEWHVDEKDYDVWGLNYRYIIGADTVISGLNYRTLEVWRVKNGQACRAKTLFLCAIWNRR